MDKQLEHDTVQQRAVSEKSQVENHVVDFQYGGDIN